MIMMQQKPGLLDSLTRVDELLEQMLAETKRQSELLEAIKTGAPIDVRHVESLYGPIQSEAEYRAALLADSMRDYDTMKFDLSSARTDEEILLEGKFLHAYTDGDIRGLGVRLNNTNAPIIYFEQRNPIDIQYFKLYLSNTAQSGKYLYLLSVLKGATGGTSPIAPHVLYVEPRVIPYSTNTSYYSTALAQYAQDDKSMTGALGNMLTIDRMTLKAKQKLDFYVLLYHKDTFGFGVIAGIIHMDMATHSILSDGYYLLTQEDLDLDYEDTDETEKFHISLYNASATPKVAGASGNVQIEVGWHLRPYPDTAFAPTE